MASLVTNCINEKISLRALKQLHRLTTIDLYRQSLGDALSDAINNYIYRHSKNNLIQEKFISNNGIEILFHDYIEASCHMSASRMIKNITADQWKKQSLKTIHFVLKQISNKISEEGLSFVLIFYLRIKEFLFYSIGTDLIEAKKASNFEIKLKEVLGFDQDHDDKKENFNIIINVLVKIFMVFGKQPFLDQSLHDPLFSYINQMWFQQINIDQHRYDIPFLLNNFTLIITQWLKLDYSIRKKYIP